MMLFSVDVKNYTNAIVTQISEMALVILFAYSIKKGLETDQIRK